MVTKNYRKLMFFTVSGIWGIENRNLRIDCCDLKHTPIPFLLRGLEDDIRSVLRQAAMVLSEPNACCHFRVLLCKPNASVHAPPFSQALVATLQLMN